MCGIAGYIDFDRSTADDALRAAARAMAETLRHRGPDGEGVWCDAARGIALAHRRLSIVDLSAAGSQPMISESGRYVITYNGEIYNAPELRGELEGSCQQAPRFRGHSDTETMLACVERWGVERALERWNGMFAFALWDRQEQALHLARDRFGEKPLYYARTARAFVFASELKALRASPGFEPQIDRDALAFFLRYNCIPAPRTIYRGACKLLPAHWLRITLDASRDARPFPYWSLREAVARGRENPFRGSDAEAAEALDELLGDAVRIRMVADVPVGVFLSGGIDSPVVAALMQAHGSRPARSFSMGMSDAGYDESRAAAEVARHLGTEHCEMVVTPEEARAAIPRLPGVYDEPFADSSQIPTLLLAQLARRHVTVGLTGDGGDELFGGYNRHVWSKRLSALIDKAPVNARRAAATAICKVSARTWDRCFGYAARVLPESLHQRTPGYKLHKLAGVLAAPNIASAYRALASHWLDPAAILRDFDAGKFAAEGSVANPPEGLAPAEQMMFLDTLKYLPDDILVKVDRATMAASLESRAPFLDHRVAEFTWRLPLETKICNGCGKQILRSVLRRRAPRAPTGQPKSGFGIPLGAWLRGPLREWAEELLDERRLRGEGYFRPEPIRETWRQHVAGKGVFEYHLWDILMFEAWLKEARRALTRSAAVAAAMAH